MSEPTDIENPEADPEIAALLDFVPVPRKTAPPGAWTPEAQRKYIAPLAVTGSQGKAAGFLGKDRGGASKLYNSPGAASFRKAWHAAIALFERRRDAKLGEGPAALPQPPTVDGRRKWRIPQAGWMKTQEEAETAVMRLAEEARASVGQKLLRCRRLYLQEIADSPGKRAAFEILTDLPIDWDRARELQPHHDEPFNTANQHQPDMILTAEGGWSFGECGYGPDRKAKMRAAVDAHRAAEGLEPVDWEDSDADGISGPE